MNDDKNTGYRPNKPYKQFTKKEKLIDWITYYRRNPVRFIEHYFGLNLYFFQKIMITLMFRFPFVVLLCSRAVSKSYTTAIFSVAYCSLYPNSKVLVTALTKYQASFNY